MKVSIVIPFHDEEENVGPVLDEVRQAHPDAEVIAVDDHSGDRTPEVLSRQAAVRVIRLPRRLGQSAAVYRGLVEATGDVCVMMDGDGQTSVSDIERLLAYIPEYDFVNGRRAERQDSPARLIASRLANWLRNVFTRDGMKDTGGSPKIMKRECVDYLIPFDGMHRFIPALLVAAGFRSIEVPVAHRERLHGNTHYTNWARGLRGAWDLIGVRWLLGRRIDAALLGVRASGAAPPSDSAHRPGSAD